MTQHVQKPHEEKAKVPKFLVITSQDGESLHFHGSTNDEAEAAKLQEAAPAGAVIVTGLHVHEIHKKG